MFWIYRGEHSHGAEAIARAVNFKARFHSTLRARCDQSDLLFYNFSIAQYYDHRRTKCVRLVVEPDSTPARDIFVGEC